MDITDKDTFSQADTYLRTTLDKQGRGQKNGKIARPLGLVHEMVKSAGKAGVSMMKDLVNQIIVGAISAEWKLSIIVNCYTIKGDPLERETNRGPKLTKQILEIVGRALKKLIRKQVNIDEMQFGFMLGCENQNAIVILKKLQHKKHLAQKNLYFAFVDLEKVFHQVLWDVVQ